MNIGFSLYKSRLLIPSNIHPVDTLRLVDEARCGLAASLRAKRSNPLSAYERTMDCFAALAMTRDMASRSRGALRPSFASSFALFIIRGHREDRVLAAPAVSRAICANKTAHEHTGQREHSGLPCAMALRLTSCSSRRTALLPPSPPRSFARQLSASTAAPEPHDFAVRFRRVRLSRPQRPPHLTARS